MVKGFPLHVTLVCQLHMLFFMMSNNEWKNEIVKQNWLRGRVINENYINRFTNRLVVHAKPVWVCMSILWPIQGSTYTVMSTCILTLSINTTKCHKYGQESNEGETEHWLIFQNMCTKSQTFWSCKNFSLNRRGKFTGRFTNVFMGLNENGIIVRF